MLNNHGWWPHPHRPVLLIEWVDCLAVDIRTGVIVAQLEGELFRACEGWWPDTDELAPGTAYASADQQLAVTSDADVLVINDHAGQLLHALDAEGAYFIAHRFAPVGHRIAAVAWDSLGVTQEAWLRLLIWDADSGKRLAAHKLAVPGDLQDLALFWNERGVVVLAHHDLKHSEDDWEAPTSAISSFFSKDGSGKVQRRLALAHDTSLGPTSTDANGLWFLSYQETFGDDDRYRGRFRAISLTDLGDGLDWRWSGSLADDDDSAVSDFRDEWTGRWRADASTQWLETSSEQSGSGSKVALEMSWKAITAEPTPSIDGRRLYAGKNLDEAKLAPKLHLLGVGEAGPLIDWGLNQAAAQPEKTRLALGGCEAVDAAPQLDRVLAICRGRRMSLVNVADQSVELELDVGSYAEVLWGRSGWLALADVSGKLLIVDLASKQLVLERSDITRLAKVALGQSLGRLGVIVGDRLQLLDATNGKQILELPKPAGQVALHPDGRQLALIADAKVQIFALDSGEVIASWPEPEFKDLAWRQDGAALLVGTGVPKKMVDPSRGELLATLDSNEWTELSYDAIDPSWRWARLRNDRILRTLDGMTIHYGPSWVRLDSGLYEGDVDLRKPPFVDLRWRTDEDIFAIPKLDNTTVEPWVERKGLLAAFFAGETIAPPSKPR
jgi:hypothetical protein